MKRRVVVTGIGAITPIGTGKDEYFKGLREGRNGIKLIDTFDTEKFTAKIAGLVDDFDPNEYINKKEAKRMDRFTQFAVACSKLALEDSKLDMDKVDKNRFGVVLGSGVGGLGTLEKEHEKLLNKGANRVSPFLIPMMISNMASGNVSMQFGCKGPNTTVVTACASGTNAIGDAFRLIQNGYADLMLTGGAEASVTPLGMAGFCTMKALSTRNDDPSSASRPFDKDRDGFVMGEGSGIVVLEEYEHAIKRGATIYAEVAGFGMSADAYHITSPSPNGEGASRSMQCALDDASISYDKVDYVNAHGTSTPFNDKFETMAIKTTFKDHAYDLCVSSTKSMTGHLLGASGAIEFISCILAVNEDFVHGTMNYHTPDPELDLNYLPNKGENRKVNYALSNSLGFGGHNASIIVKKFKK
ncbi:beta-ketoacyl-ACP synthase II [Helicovermis profundi]|uniref:3-oxoacyl-[acyl-carrier-protein] synthase 2 n=1 Tax=Helicovermis profundi TaxID=3065157 RepID=A0AAU9E9H5_9FIRM|nr:beta-ketoacyl-ACP synthase II [Clostridia bacterium S502]